MISFIAAAIILNCFLQKTAYKKRFFIVIIAAFVSFIPLTIVNGIKSSAVERTPEIVTLEKIKIQSTLQIKIDSTRKKEIPVFIKTSGSKISFSIPVFFNEDHTWDINSPTLHISFINSGDSIALVRCEMTKDLVVKSPGFKWYSPSGIPGRNKQIYLYLPNDYIHHALIERAKSYGKV